MMVGEKIRMKREKRLEIAKGFVDCAIEDANAAKLLFENRQFAIAAEKSSLNGSYFDKSGLSN